MGHLTFDELAGLGSNGTYTGLATPGGTAAAGGSTVSTRFDPAVLYRTAARRFKGMFYEQPKAWHVDRRGRRTPIMRVGGGWSRAGVRRAARAAEGTDLAAERKFVEHFKDAYRSGKGSPTWRSFWNLHWRRSKDIDRMVRARKLADRRRERARLARKESARKAALAQAARRRAAWEKRQGIKPYRGITPREARRQRDEMIAWNTRLAIQREQRERQRSPRPPRGGLVTSTSPFATARPMTYAQARF
jgi:hypothetical protein